MDLWMRLGDQGEYFSPELLWEVGDELFRLGITEFTPCIAGCEAEGYSGNDYISVFWGDEDCVLIRELTPGEWVSVRRRLADLWTHRAATEDRVNSNSQNRATTERESNVSAVTKRCFVFIEPPKHNKFWTIEVAGSTAFVTYGKIGSRGATQVKPFGSAREANQFAVKMIQEKMNKGYSERPSPSYPGAPPEQLAAASGDQARQVVSSQPPAPPPATMRRGRRNPPPDDSRPEDGERFLDL